MTGASAQDVTDAIAQAYPNTNPPALIEAALDRIAQSANFDPATLTGFCLEATRELFRRMTEIGDFHGALAAVKQLHQLANVRK